jgi:hypothetical protein
MKQLRAELWTKWRGLLSEQSQSGQTVSAFCRDRGLRDSLFFDWKKRIREGEAAKFVEVKVKESSEQRKPASRSGKRYTPLIIPPTYFKGFTPSIFQQLWKNCTDVLSTPKRVVFLGYSLPAADLHAQSIFRCGFYNQLHGRLRKGGDRYPATGASESIIVNPDQDSARRIESVAGPQIPCTWVPKQIADWLDEIA